MFINADESSKIMKISEENIAAALVKNRRVTVAGGEEARDTDHPKRAKRAAAAAPPLDDNGEFFLFPLWVCTSYARAVCHYHC
jgi:hypothetical protein